MGFGYALNAVNACSTPAGANHNPLLNHLGGGYCLFLVRLPDMTQLDN
jgi:hypothetical protein